MPLDAKNAAATKTALSWRVRLFFWWARTVLKMNFLTVHTVKGKVRGVTVSDVSYRWLHRPPGEGEHVCSWIEPPGSWGKAP
jgi:hypothetical protein